MRSLHQQRLLDLLAGHVPADALEREHLARIAAFVAVEPACFSRRTFEPGHITGSGFVVDPARRLLLLHHHRKLDRWLQLGGHDDGELDAAATALREAREESGLAQVALAQEPPAVLDVDVHAIPAGAGEPAHLHFDLRFLFFADSSQPLALDAAESRALCWLPLAEAPVRMGEVGALRVARKIEAALR